jgi:hypothetical protein
MTMTSSNDEDGVATVLRLAHTLARPVARGLLFEHQAEAALLALALRLDREARLTCDPLDLVAWSMHLLRLRVADLGAEREVTAGCVALLVGPMLIAGLPPCQVRATAHAINDAANSPLSDAELHAAAVRGGLEWTRRNG